MGKGRMDRISEEIRTDVDGLENGCGSYPCRWTLGRMWERPCTSTSKRRERARVVVVRPGVRRRGRSFHHAWDARCFESAHGCNEVDGTECVRWQRLHRRMHVSRSKHPGGTVSTTRWCRFDRARMKLSSSPSAFRNRIGDAALLVERSTTSNAPFTRLRATRRPRMPAKRFAAACSIRSTNHWCDRCTRRNDDVRRSVFVEDGRTSLVDVSRSRRGDWYVCCVEETQLYGANPPKIHVEILSSEIRTWMGLRRPNLPRIRVGFDASSERRPWIIHRPGRAGASRETAISHDVLQLLPRRPSHPSLEMVLARFRVHRHQTDHVRSCLVSAGFQTLLSSPSKRGIGRLGSSSDVSRFNAPLSRSSSVDRRRTGGSLEQKGTLEPGSFRSERKLQPGGTGERWRTGRWWGREDGGKEGVDLGHGASNRQTRTFEVSCEDHLDERRREEAGGTGGRPRGRSVESGGRTTREQNWQAM